MKPSEYNDGIRQGYRNALHTLRKVDRSIEYPRSDKDWNENNIKYNTSKDLIHQIYGLIKKDMEEQTDDTN